jgi:hypothetical protein
LQKCLILTATEDIRQSPPGLMIQRLPEPPRLCFAAHKRPHLVQFGLCYLVNYHCGVYSPTSWRKSGVHLVDLRDLFLSVVITVVGLTPSTRAVSRMPLPFSAMSTICRLTSGNRPLF